MSLLVFDDHWSSATVSLICTRLTACMICKISAGIVCVMTNSDHRPSFLVLTVLDLAIHPLEVPSYNRPVHAERDTLFLHDCARRQPSKVAKILRIQEGVGEILRNEQAFDSRPMLRSRFSKRPDRLQTRSTIDLQCRNPP